MAKIKTWAKRKRLAKAKAWLLIYNGKNLVSGYARRFAVDLPCAIAELRMLGVVVTEEYEAAVKRSLADRALQKKQKKAAREQQAALQGYESDATFAFIAGYTSGGAPYGTTWEEAALEDK